MAEHVVPQDVEAEDKIIGPFGIRQFIYLAIAGGFGTIAYFLIVASVALAPIAAVLILAGLFLIVLALPLRKEQPTEVYLAAVARYALKSQSRTWIADGETPIVEIAAPAVDNTLKVKEIPSEEVSRRLSFLANISDTQGWSTRGVSAPVDMNTAIENSNLNDDFAYDAVNAADMLDNHRVRTAIDSKLDQSANQIRQNAMQMMANAALDANNQQDDNRQSTSSTAAVVPQLQSTPQSQPQSIQPAPVVVEAPAVVPVPKPEPVIAPPMPPTPPMVTAQPELAITVPERLEPQPAPVVANPYDVYNAPVLNSNLQPKADIINNDNSIIDVKFH